LSVPDASYKNVLGGEKVICPLFRFNGARPALLLFRRVISALLRSAGNSIHGFVDLEWWKNNT
jgi:hypothetical protein